MQHAFHRVGQRDVLTLHRLATRLQTGNVAGHFRRLAEQHVQRHVDRLVVEVAVVQRQVLFFGRFADHRIRCALAAADLVELRHLRRGNRHHVTLLRFVAPHFQRAHARLVVEDIAQLEAAAAAAVAHQLRHGVGQTAGADVMDKQDRVLVAQLPAAVDHFLTAALHFRVVALHRREVQIGIGLA